MENCFTSALPMWENHLLYRTQNHLLESFGHLIFFPEIPVKWVCKMVLNVQRMGKEPQIHFSDGLPLDHRVSLGSNLMGQSSDIHSTISPFGSKTFTTALPNHPNDFVGRRQMANHDHQTLTILSQSHFRMIWNDFAWTVLWTSGKWLAISCCKHDFKAMMVLLKWFVGRGQVREQNDLRWWQV